MPVNAAELWFEPARGILVGCIARSPARLIIERDGARTVILIGDDSTVEIGSEVSPADLFACEERVNREIAFEYPRRLRLLLRQTMLELYINDILIQCYTMTTAATGRVSWTGVEDPKGWYWPSDDTEPPP